MKKNIFACLSPVTLKYNVLISHHNDKTNKPNCSWITG